jgi:putative drug exporter of the RND superfamily
MFKFLSRWDARYKYPIILFWIVLTVVLVSLAPSLSKVGVTDDSQFLPRDTESIMAQQLIKTRFASAAATPPGSALVVVHNPQGLKDPDLAVARAFNAWLLSDQAPAIIRAVTSPLTTPALSATLISRDNTTLLISLELSEASASAPARAAVNQMRDYVAGLHSETSIYVTGGAGIASDALTSINQTIDKATLVTVLLVIVLLLLIYRSPVAMLVPLVTIGVSYLISRSLAAFIAQAGVQVSTLVDAYLVVTLFGIGTDYCLFIISRYKEEMLQHDRSTAAGLTLQKIGPVIVASATTVIVALLCLLISRFGMIRNSGLILAIGVAITLIAGLTLTPALIAAFGRRILWPAGIQHHSQPRPGLWHKIAHQVVRRPWLFVIPIVVILALPYLALPQIKYSSALIAQMPEEIGSVKGYHVLTAHFPTGSLSPADLLIEAPAGSLYDPAALAVIRATADSLQKLEGVSGVTFYGSALPQLQQLSGQVRTLSDNLGLATLGQLAALPNLEGSLKALAVQYPGITQSTHFQAAATALAKIAEGGAALKNASPTALPAALAALKPGLNGLADSLEGLAAEFSLAGDSQFTQWLKAQYFSLDGALTRVLVTTAADPYSAESSHQILAIRQSADRSLKASGYHYYVGGTAADQADILAINNTDFLRVLGLTIIGILLVTAILLRSLVAPLYMILTVLFNFGATIGISTWLFFDILHHAALIYMLPIFVFVILVAVGADYNIFLVTRIREESRSKSIKEAISTAVANTGGVITSCGIILAGTFATLTTASLQMVLQIGAAIAIGVIIDTFLVRAVLIPSLAALLGRWNWWPSRTKH